MMSMNNCCGCMVPPKSGHTGLFFTLDVGKIRISHSYRKNLNDCRGIKMLTIRGFRLLTKLLETSSSVYLKDLSEEFNVSTRMIKYDLDDVKGWFNEQGIEVCSQSNKGIWIDCDEETRLTIIRSLSEIERNDVYLNQEARVGKMILYMLVTTDH